MCSGVEVQRGERQVAEMVIRSDYRARGVTSRLRRQGQPWHFWGHSHLGAVWGAEPACSGATGNFKVLDFVGPS